MSIIQEGISSLKKVYLKILQMKRVVRFGKKVKLIPRFVCPHEILKRVGKVSYELKLYSELALSHPFSMFVC